MTIPWPAFVLETNGISVISDGTAEVTFESLARLNAAAPDFVLPEGVIGLVYEKRPDALIHRETRSGGAVVFRDGTQNPAIEALLDRFDNLVIAFEAQQHPLYGLTNNTAARELACALIDAAAEEARLVHITAGDGQAMVYLEKARQAEALITAQSAGQTIENSDWPLLATEAAALDIALLELARTVLEKRDLWITLAAQIETARRSGKNAVTRARTADTIKSAYDQAITSLEQLQRTQTQEEDTDD